MKYKDIYYEFSSDKRFKKMGEEIHHGTNRLAHSVRVAKLSFFVSKVFRCDTLSTTRGALLHDNFLNKDFYSAKHHLSTHPYLALINSNSEYVINDVEKDIISSHMFPITKTFPKYRESYIVSICDKIVSIYEFLRYQIKYATYFLMIFTFERMKFLSL